jgi:hypothetical protein
MLNLWLSFPVGAILFGILVMLFLTRVGRSSAFILFCVWALLSAIGLGVLLWNLGD